MQVILLESIQGVGQIGQTVNVANGYARNFLLPRNKALLANKDNVAKFEADRKAFEAKQGEAKKNAEAQAAKLENASVTLQRQASEVGMLYGSVKARDIETALDEKGITVEKSLIQIGAPIKEIGEHTVQLFLHADVVVPLAVVVERQSQA